MTTRRHFIHTLPLAGAAALASRTVRAQPAIVGEKDPQAVALGYVADASRVDRARYKAYADGQACAKCALFTGAAGASTGPCGLFPGKHVAAIGWCSAFSRRG